MSSQIRQGALQTNVLVQMLCLSYRCDIPDNENIKIATFADDTVVLAVGNTMDETTANLQSPINQTKSIKSITSKVKA